MAKKSTQRSESTQYARASRYMKDNPSPSILEYTRAKIMQPDVAKSYDEGEYQRDQVRKQGIETGGYPDVYDQRPELREMSYKSKK